MQQRPPRKIVLSTGPGSGRSERPAAATRRTPTPSGRGSWLLPPLLVSAVASAALLVRGDLDGYFGLAFGLLVALGLSWVLVSVFFPARADRRCPRCGAEALERVDPRATRGLRCTACGHCDESASAWLIAEEEGPLEPAVLRERGREAAPAAAETSGPLP